MREPNLTDNARRIFDLRYSRKDEEGHASETPADAIDRVVTNVASVNALYADFLPSEKASNELWDQLPYKTAHRQYRWLGLTHASTELDWSVAEEQAELYREMLTNLDFVPNSPTWTGAGTGLGQLAACFVLPIYDDIGGEANGIFDTMREAVLIQQTGGGNGFSFGRIRPKGALVRASMGKASGPVGFMRAYDTAFETVAQGGTRRGANMGVLPVSHPDVEEFINAKVIEGELSNFNISVAITDAFMEAVDKDDMFELTHDGTVYRTIFARELFDVLVKDAWVIGDPGCLFIDAANRENPLPLRYELEATNPCITGDTWVMTPNGPEYVYALEMEYGSGEVVIDGQTHKADFIETGVKPVFILSTKEGYTLRLTANHRVMLEGGEWVEAQHLSPGDRIRLHDHGTDLEWTNPEMQFPGEDAPRGFDEGYLVGLWVGDGTRSGVQRRDYVLNAWATDPGHEGPMAEALAAAQRAVAKHDLPVRSDWTGWTGPHGNGWYRLSVKAVSNIIDSYDDDGVGPWENIESSTSDFYRGFLRALFDADGHIESGNGSPNVRFTQSDMETMRAVQRMLLRLGIFSRIYPMKPEGTSLLPDGKGGVKEYPVRESWRLVVSGESAKRFAQRIGFANEEKMEALQTLLDGMGRGPYKQSFVATFEALVPDGEEKVYDVVVHDDLHAFDANGLYVHNCGEQWLGPHENCCLGSINLSNFASFGDDEGPWFDWSRFRDTIRLATEFLDDVIDANQYVAKVPQLEVAAQGARRIGLGAMGLADAMAKLGIRYGSKEGQEFAAQVTEFMRYHTMDASISRAADRGPFEWVKGSIYDPELLEEYGEGAEVETTNHEGEVVTYNLWSRPTPLALYAHDFGRPELHWDVIYTKLCRYGIRNAAQLTYAPTGTISNVAGLQGSGCEPFFALVYERHVMQEGENIVLSYLNPVFEEALEWEGFTADERATIMGQVKDNGGSCQGLDEVPSYLQDSFVVAADVTPEGHVRMQASIQAFVDNSISKTINLPNDATVEDVAEVYRLAYELGCKGITIYRQGSRDVEVLTTTKKATVEADLQVTEDTWLNITPMPMPVYAETEGLPARTIKVRTPHGAMWATVTELEDHPGRPFDVRLQLGKAGNDKMADIEAIGRTVSLALRGGVTVEKVVEQLEGIGGSTVAGFGPSRVKSAADGLAMMLRRTYLDAPEPVTIGNGDVDASRICPECHNATLVFEQGCLHCEVRLGGCGRYQGCD